MVQNEDSEVTLVLISSDLELTPAPRPSASCCASSRMIGLYLASAAHFTSALIILVDLARHTRFFVLSERHSPFDSSLLSFDFIFVLLLLGWSALQAFIAYHLNANNALKASSLSWVILLVEAVIVAVLGYGLFGSGPPAAVQFQGALKYILSTVVLWQLVFTILVTSFIQRKVLCCTSPNDYQLLV